MEFRIKKKINIYFNTAYYKEKNQFVYKKLSYTIKVDYTLQ